MLCVIFSFLKWIWRCSRNLDKLVRGRVKLKMFGEDGFYRGKKNYCLRREVCIWSL